MKSATQSVLGFLVGAALVVACASSEPIAPTDTDPTEPGPATADTAPATSGSGTAAAPAAACVSKCTADDDCAKSCPAVTGAVQCCDTATGACFASKSAECPAPTDPDAGSTTAGY